MLLQYRTHLSPYTPCTTSRSGRSAPFSYSHLWSPLHRHIYICTEALMDILGLDPYQSQTQYLEENFRGIAKWKQSGNAVAAPLLLCCTFVSSSPNSSKNSGNKTATCCRLYNPYLQ